MSLLIASKTPLHHRNRRGLGCFPWQKYLLTAEITAKPISDHTAGN
jgi:hypothetical protein